MAGDEILCLERLTIEVATPTGAARVVDDASLTVRAGRTLGIVGESGSGKSMMCLSLLGLLPVAARIVSGAIWFKGENLALKSRKEIARYRGRGIGIILQDHMTSLNPLFRIGDQIAEVFKYHHRIASRSERWRRAAEIMRQVRIPAADRRIQAYPHQFSGGMRQRISVAINIGCDPDLLIADEPTTALDVTSRTQILQLLRDIQHSRGTAAILVTHDLHAVARFCDEIAVMYAGRVIEQGPMADVFARPAHPYTAGLIAAVPRISLDEQRLAVIPGHPPRPGEVVEGCAFAPRCPRASQLCTVQAPQTREFEGGRSAACWLPDGVVEAAA
ncbi:oligopeptide/dipeptide ABC transporter ATP-binding protein [Bradyrhizobium sp. AZCC 2262]|uniref:ABC transporter ATP-binding protein n=1 Tax=Bradyrhizobium sp. AZCC 2262 TaxID=3117022 RepID=UPI002FF3650C